MNTHKLLSTTTKKWLTWLAPILLLSSLVVVLMTTLSGAWGPSERKTFTIENPASYVTFNSITNNANHGDERNFVQAKPTSNTSPGGWKDELAVEVGKEYWVRVYVHNNAAANLNLVATNSRMTIAIPNEASTSATVIGQVSADNANPKSVWDETVLKSDSPFLLKYIAGSAQYTTNAVEKMSLSDTIVTSEGALLGYETLDGKIPGCFQYSGIATIKVVVQAPQESVLSVEKKVRIKGETEWQKRVSAKVGDTVEYQIGYKNIGNTVQKDVQIFDKLPAGVSYVDGSTTLKNASNSQGNGKSVADGVTTSGIKIGDYDTGANAYVRFAATIGESSDYVCGENTLRNFGHASVDGTTKQDAADVIVTIECQPDECKPGIKKGDSRCEEACVPGEDEIVDENGNCVPAALPTTGPAEIIAGVLGVTLVSLGIAYWIRSRNEYKKATAGHQPGAPNLPFDHQ